MERTLSKNEARVILELEWQGRTTVTLSDLHEMLDASESYARYLAYRLVKKGWLERLRPGLFQLVPANRGRDGVADTNPLAAGAVLVSPYFFSFGTACTHHGLTEQRFSEVYLACRERRAVENIRGIRYVFVRVPERRFFGFTAVRVLGAPVQMATLERALLDAIDRPRYSGGIGEVSRISMRAAPRISWDMLVALTRRWGSSALAQRLGYFLELHDAHMPETAKSELLAIIRSHSKIHLGSRRMWGTTGVLAKPWNVVVNVPREVLVASDELGRRRIVLGSKEKNQ
ncbi:MAG TPA: type IV toxin-antitoxin system AbiEi family antitoxin domain-containing protein [Myxococcota bacterium]|nr:type IV toxin-antitoxin system AbiEi family antitoxin domain-containing protein [Myxococcota bacterium]